MPTLTELDSELRKAGLPVHGEMLLATATFATGMYEDTETVAADGGTHQFRSRDYLQFKVHNLTGASCIVESADGAVYIDIPTTAVTQNDVDRRNKAYIVTGFLLGRNGRPLRNQQVIFLPLDTDGRGRTMYHPQTMPGRLVMRNPRTWTTSEGGFELRIPAMMFAQSADPMAGLLQVVVVDTTQPGRLLHVGAPLVVKRHSGDDPKIDIGRVTVSIP